MRAILLTGVFLLAVATTATAQDGRGGGDVALTYQWLRTNAAPGECGCFDLNGGAIAASLNLSSRWSVVAAFTGGYGSNLPPTGGSLTLTSYLAGARYRVPWPWSHSAHSLQPFAQALVGAAHAGGTVAGSGDGTYVFATRIGGGMDLPLGSRFAVRLFDVDYDRTLFKNGVNNRQNNLSVSAGIVFRWSFNK